MTENQLNTPDEIWKGIPGFPGYEVSDQGRVRSFQKFMGRGRGWIIADQPQRILQPVQDKKGYLRVHLDFMRQVHRLVLLTFIGPCPLGMEGCHNDDVKRNNYLYNLRWDTPQNNMVDKVNHGLTVRGQKSPHSKLNEDQVKQIRFMGVNGHTHRHLAKIYNVDPSTIHAILHRRKWKHI